MSKPRRRASLIIALIISFIFALILSVASLVFIYLHLISPVSSSNTNPVVFVIKRGESVTSIGNRLQEQGLIRNALVFKIIVKKDHLTSKIQAGDFKLTPNLSTPELAKSLTKGTLDIWITTLEGWRREEIADYLEKTLSAESISFDKQAFLSLTTPDEGYLFPDSYLIPRSITPTGLVQLFRNTFDSKVDSQALAVINSSGHSLSDIVTMASIVEREARGSARPIVAGILWKRLDNDWPLQADATLQYAKGYDSREKTWWPTPLAADKELDSPYNTYQNLGLPAGPICNPSLDSIMAAAEPTATDYWFYITDNDGRMHYSVTADEHNSNVNQYLR